MAERIKLPHRRELVRQKVTIGGKRTFYLDVGHLGDGVPVEVFGQAKDAPGAERCPTCDQVIDGTGITPELTGLYNCHMRDVSRMIQSGIDLEIAARIAGQYKSQPSGVVVGDARIKNCSSVLDWIARHLLVNYCGRDDLAHVRTCSE